MKTIVKAEDILNTRNFQRGREKGDLRARYNGIDYDFVRRAVGINGTDYKWYIRPSDEPRNGFIALVRGLRDKPLPTNVQKYLDRYIDNRDNTALRNLKTSKAEERTRTTQKNQSTSPVKVVPKISYNTRNRQYLNSLSEEERNVLENMGIDLSSAKNLQKSLNTVLGINLLEDNKIGDKTKAAVKEALLRGPQRLELTEMSPIGTTYQQPEISTTTEGIRPTMQTTAPINWRTVRMEELPDYASMIRNMKFQKGGNLFKYLIDKQIEEHDKYYNDYGLRKPNSENYLKKAKYYFKQPNIQDKVTGAYYYIKSDPLKLYGLKKGVQQDIRKLQREDERTLSNLKLKLLGF